MFEESSSLTTSLLAAEKEETTIPEAEALLVSSEVVVESTAKDAKGDVESTSVSNQENEVVVETSALTSSAVSWDKGEQQPSKCRDGVFAVLFLLQFVTVFSIGSIYIHQLVKQRYFSFTHQDASYKKSSANDEYSLLEEFVITPTLIAICTSVLLILVSFIVLTKMAKSFITCSLYTSAIVSFAIGIVSFANGAISLGILSIISALIGLWYAISVRNRVPFAAANLNAAVSSITNNYNLSGILQVAAVIGMAMFTYMILWTVSLIQVTQVTLTDCNMNDDDTNPNNCSVQVKRPIFFLPWIIFLFWTQQTSQNILHTTTAGITSSWYFTPSSADNTSCTSCLCPNKTVLHALIRSTTTSFGSICFGSLCVAILQTLDFMVQMLRSENNRQRNGGSGGAALLLCCLDCVLRLLQNVVEYFNKWAFVYVGIYGYPFVEAGKKVMTLFKQRGWTVIINDNLIRNALGLMSFVIALLSGVVPLMIVSLLHAGGVDKSEIQQWGLPIFSICFTIGLIFSTTVMSIIDSAVCTIIVCFAEAPHDLDVNHSTHSRNMREAWNEVYQIQI
mmetsp:Transcript_5839/g.7446  ORF Transcript_5839/g.7446 Transcript_5839/m.7446 type:complete len:563 (+) Transcript_5839:118-1806(+)